MTQQTCRRCRKQEHIPTFQYVKFDEQVSYLCAACWSLFRSWFNVGQQTRDIRRPGKVA